MRRVPRRCLLRWPVGWLTGVVFAGLAVLSLGVATLGAATAAPRSGGVVPVRIYEWTGRDGVTHFSGTPPPKNSPGVSHLRRKILELAPVSARQARRDYRATLRAAHSMEQGLRALEREQAGRVVSQPPYPETGSAPVAPVGYADQGGAFYPPLGFYPVGLGPPPGATPPHQAPDLSPPGAGFGICGYEITCPGTNTPPVVGMTPPFFPQPHPAAPPPPPPGGPPPHPPH
jgi:hypothetical protein